MAKLSGEEIVSIIRAGHESKVATLELGAIKITYKGAEPEIIQQPVYTLQNRPPETPQDLAQSDSNPDQELLDLQLAITDPQAWERKHILGEITE